MTALCQPVTTESKNLCVAMAALSIPLTALVLPLRTRYYLSSMTGYRLPATALSTPYAII